MKEDQDRDKDFLELKESIQGEIDHGKKHGFTNLTNDETMTIIKQIEYLKSELSITNTRF